MTMPASVVSGAITLVRAICDAVGFVTFETTKLMDLPIEKLPESNFVVKTNDAQEATALGEPEDGTLNCTLTGVELHAKPAPAKVMPSLLPG